MREPTQTEPEFNWKNGEIPRAELQITAMRGGGPGGQAINTTSNNMEVRWVIGNSNVLSDEQKDLLRQAAGRRVTKADELIFKCQSERSQTQNTNEATRRLNEFVRAALTPEAERKKTKKPKRVKAKEMRKSHAEKHRKAGRGRVKNWD
jgi:ribosome-associated protein